MRIKMMIIAAATMFVAAPLLHAEEAYLNYKTYCMQCHGMHGKGNGVNVPAMNILPRDHSDNAYMMKRTNTEIFKVIKYGGPALNKSVKMPPWGDTFTDHEITELVGHIRSLCCEKELIRGVNFR